MIFPLFLFLFVVSFKYQGEGENHPFESLFVQWQQVIHKSDFKFQVPGEGGREERDGADVTHRQNTDNTSTNKPQRPPTNEHHNNSKEDNTITNSKQNTPNKHKSDFQNVLKIDWKKMIEKK